MGTMHSIIALKDHLGFKDVYGSKFPWQSKEINFTFKMDVDLPRSGVDLVKHMHVKGDMKKS